MARWMLPDGIEELLPARARVMENLRRALLDHFSCYGYDLVMPPFLEYLDSLMIGTGQDLESQTFRVTDPLTGKLMGLRADMTLQAARIDAHQIQHDDPVRLCYIGTVLRSHPDGFAGSRAPLQVGAELYGHAGIESDLEILELMLDTLQLTGIEDIHIDLGHVGIYRGLVRQAGLSAQAEQELFAALQRKALPEIRQLLSDWQIDPGVESMLAILADLNGGEETLARARESLRAAESPVHNALDDLERIAQQLKLRRPGLPVHFDLAELRGYAYQTGMVFAAFVPGYGQEIARGGRYDEIGSIFGRARPATGFSADLKTLIRLSRHLPSAELSGAIYAPAEQDAALLEKVRQLRSQGERVIMALPGQSGGVREMGCDRELVRKGKQWQLVSVS